MLGLKVWTTTQDAKLFFHSFIQVGNFAGWKLFLWSSLPLFHFLPGLSPRTENSSPFYLGICFFLKYFFTCSTCSFSLYIFIRVTINNHKTESTLDCFRIPSSNVIYPLFRQRQKASTLFIKISQEISRQHTKIFFSVISWTSTPSPTPVNQITFSTTVFHASSTMAHYAVLKEFHCFLIPKYKSSNSSEQRLGHAYHSISILGTNFCLWFLLLWRHTRTKTTIIRKTFNWGVIWNSKVETIIFMSGNITVYM